MKSATKIVECQPRRFLDFLTIFEEFHDFVDLMRRPGWSRRHAGTRLLAQFLREQPRDLWKIDQCTSTRQKCVRDQDVYAIKIGKGQSSATDNDVLDTLISLAHLRPLHSSIQYTYLSLAVIKNEYHRWWTL